MQYSDNIIMMPFEPKRPYQEIGLVLRQELINGRYVVGDSCRLSAISQNVSTLAAQ